MPRANAHYRAHPRECGEDPCLAKTSWTTCGSPPRMRGRRCATPARALTPRLTPANAGKTCATPTRRGPPGAHPRECGEDTVERRQITGPTGSPPRMRGRRVHDREVLADRGLTPANAGKTGRRPGCAAGWWAHPRECGEDPAVGHHRPPVVGSPPRMRGRLVVWVVGVPVAGLTPANAGKTPHCPGRCGCVRAHPRECGEDGLSGKKGFVHPGSPPRMRGRPGSQGRSQPRAGLTPANAGKTSHTNVPPR